MIAHRLSTIQDADLILVFKEGQIAERGTPVSYTHLRMMGLFRFAMACSSVSHKGLGLSQQAFFGLGAGAPLKRKSASAAALAVLAIVSFFVPK